MAGYREEVRSEATFIRVVVQVILLYGMVAHALLQTTVVTPAQFYMSALDGSHHVGFKAVIQSVLGWSRSTTKRDGGSCLASD